jgi:hypothetical protein
MVERTQPAWAATDTLTAGAARHAAGLSATGWSEAASGQSVSSFENVLESHLPAQGKAAAATRGQASVSSSVPAASLKDGSPVTSSEDLSSLPAKGKDMFVQDDPSLASKASAALQAELQQETQDSTHLAVLAGSGGIHPQAHREAVPGVDAPKALPKGDVHAEVRKARLLRKPETVSSGSPTEATSALMQMTPQSLSAQALTSAGVPAQPGMTGVQAQPVQVEASRQSLHGARLQAGHDGSNGKSLATIANDQAAKVAEPDEAAAGLPTPEMGKAQLTVGKDTPPVHAAHEEASTSGSNVESLGLMIGATGSFVRSLASTASTSSPPLTSLHSEHAQQTQPDSATMLVATPNVLEVGVSGGPHGWLKVRAELGSDGGINAQVSASSASAAAALHKEMPALTAYLEQEQVAVSGVSVHTSSSSSASPEAAGAHVFGGDTGSAPAAGNGGSQREHGDGNGAGAGQPDQAGDRRIARLADSANADGLVPVASLFPRAANVGAWLSVRV